MAILDITGTAWDGLCDRLGLNPTILTYGSIRLKPNPMVAYLGLRPHTDVPSPYNDGEILETWETSIPAQTLQAALGVGWLERIQPAWADQQWRVQMTGRPAVRVRVFGVPGIDALSDRCKLTLVGMGLED